MAQTDRQTHTHRHDKNITSVIKISKAKALNIV